MELRGYQREAVAAVEAAWASGMTRPAVVMATGLGKTHVFADLCRKAVAEGNRPLILVHRRELIDQATDKLRTADPSLRVGVIQAKRCELDADVVVASVPTLKDKKLLSIPSERFNLVVVDECHHATAPTYKAVMEHFGCYDGGALSVGVTATLARSDKTGLGSVWMGQPQGEDLPDLPIVDLDIPWGVDAGWLVPTSVRTVWIPDLDTDKVAKTGGDFSPADLARAMTAAHSGPIIAAAYAKYGRDEAGDLRRGIVFCTTIEAAESLRKDLQRVGARCDLLTGKTPDGIRKVMFDRLRDHDTDLIVSIMALTEGFDLPQAEVAIIARPTKSMPFLTQMVGRVLRPADGKESALVLDASGYMGRGLVSPIDLRIPKPAGDPGESDEDREIRERRDNPPKRISPNSVEWREVQLSHEMEGMSATPNQLIRLEALGLAIEGDVTAKQALDLLNAA